MTGTNYTQLSGLDKLRVVTGRRKRNELARERRRDRLREVRRIVHRVGDGSCGCRVIGLVMRRLGVSRRTAYRDLRELRAHRRQRLHDTGGFWS